MSNLKFTWNLNAQMNWKCTVKGEKISILHTQVESVWFEIRKFAETKSG